MRLPLAVVAVVTLVFLAGCGGSSEYQFVGTWRLVGARDDPGGLVITRVPDGYQAFLFGESGPAIGPIPLQRHGDVLVFAAQGGLGRDTYTYHPDTGRLTVKYASAGLGIDFERVSRSISHPSPFPYASPE